jgi:rhomboid protease GluP
VSADAPDAFPQTFALRAGQGAIVLHATGLRHPRFPRWLGETFTRWSDVTHHAASARGLRLGTRRSVYVFPRSLFVDPAGPDELARALVDRIAGQPGGREQLDRMWRAEKLAAKPGAVRLAPALAAACVLVFALGLLPGGDRLFFAGVFSAALVREGEWWRVVTANLLHGGVEHLLLNVLGLLALGPLVERVLGSARSTLVLGAAALGGMGAGLLAEYEMAVGASGVVFGLAGALLALELGWSVRLPVGWRVPRGWLIAALVGDGILSFVMPSVAAAAHAGGLAAGGLACAAVARGALDRARPWAGLWALDGALALGLAASLASAVALAGGGGSPLARRGERLVEREGVGALTLNNFAWMIATDARATPEDLEVAIRLAERAVEETARRDPNVLDTLAEAQFAAGLADEAVRTIEEAIALAPGEIYFQEQRRRFLGERAPEDRPPSPPFWIQPDPDALPPEDELPFPDAEEAEPGLRV